MCKHFIRFEMNNAYWSFKYRETILVPCLLQLTRAILLLYHLKFWITKSIGIPVKSLLNKLEQLIYGIQVKHLYYLLIRCKMGIQSNPTYIFLHCPCIEKDHIWICYYKVDMLLAGL